MNQLVRSQLHRVVAVVVIVIAFSITQLPKISQAERTTLSSEFKFTETPLPVVTVSDRHIRTVHRDLENIAGWISSVGAAGALNDLDGDGLPNDACYVDTRTDEVVITPVPGSGDRYVPFALNPQPLRYDETMAPMGCVPGDINEDGLMDAFVYYWGRPPILYIHDAASDALSPDAYIPQELTDDFETWFTNAAAFADVDGDTHPDIIIGNYFQDGGAILDPSNDERQYMQHSMSRAFNAGVNRIFLWQKADAGSATYVQADTGLDIDVLRGWTLALATADLNGDLLPEIYFANDFGPDRLLYNQSEPGKLAFTLIDGGVSADLPSSRILGHDSFKGMGADFADLNHDGMFDLYVSNIADEFALQESHFLYLSDSPVRLQDGDAPFTDQGEELGVSRSNWGWDARLADLNNDGVLEALQVTGFLKGKVDRWPQLHELAMGNDELLSNPLLWPHFREGDDLSGDGHLFFFARSDSGRYFDISADIGVNRNLIGRGIALADVDGDGDLDFFTANQWDNAYFYQNVSEDTGNSITLELVYPIDESPEALTILKADERGDLKSRAAIGATARLELPDGEAVIAQVDGGSGHSGKRSHQIHFGLGDVSEGLPVQIQWRALDGTVQTQTISLSPGRYVIVLS